MQDMLAAINAGLIVMALVFMVYFMQYQYARRKEIQTTPVAIFGWAIFMISIGIFCTSVLYFLWDYGVIYKSTQYKLSVIPRGIFLGGLAMAFRALEIPRGTIVTIVALCLAIGVLVARIVW